MRVLVFGGGAVGLGLASCLLRSGVSVMIVAREKTIAALRREGLVRKGIFGQFTAPPAGFACATTMAQADNIAYDYVLVCTKSFDSPAVARELAGCRLAVGPTTKIILCQNGWGNAEVFARGFPEAVIYNARVITGFVRDKPNEVTVTVHADAIHVGSLFGPNADDIGAFCDAIRAGGIPCEPTAEISRDLWAKMLYNCPLNPLGAILGATYGELGAAETTRRVMDQIVAEVLAVMQRSGYQTHWASPEAFLEAFYGRQIPATADHESSMLQDIRRQKRTEIDALNGQVVRLGAAHGVATPVNAVIVGLVHFMEGRP